ncbi:MAG TPA: tyrosine-type recombinase/integrase, partial [Dehalococcoidia bacterium]|nr:tyrosine-type recombinase/integrase [Dehalococcoidia bacterium]
YRVSDAFRRLVARTELGHVRFYDLRHTAATLMMQAGVPTKVVSTRLGHATAALTLDVYSHVTPDMQREAVAAIDDLLQVHS